MARVELSGINKSYGAQRALRDLNLVVENGEFFVLLGRTGAGKTSTLRMIAGLESIDSGEIHVDGRRVDTLAPGDRNVAMVFQQFGLLPWRTVRENVGLGLELAGIPPAERLPRVDRQLELVNLSQWAERKVGELSGGMQQRVGLARAFVTEAPILLMDEPFSALDPLIRAKLQDELLDLQAKLKRTIVFVSHDLDEAFKIGNRIALMEGGRIVQCGTAREIIANPVSEYVADFVAHMNPLGVLTARDVMEHGAARSGARELPAETPVKDILDLMSKGVAELVVTENGRNLGMVRTASLMAKLINPRG